MKGTFQWAKRDENDLTIPINEFCSFFILSIFQIAIFEMRILILHSIVFNYYTKVYTRSNNWAVLAACFTVLILFFFRRICLNNLRVYLYVLAVVELLQLPASLFLFYFSYLLKQAAGRRACLSSLTVYLYVLKIKKKVINHRN